MMFALTALFVIAADVSLAVRQSLKMTGSDGASHVLEKISALVEKHHSGNAKALANVRALMSITPGATDSLNLALEKVISEMEANIEPAIQRSFSSTQAAISSQIHELSDTTQEALSKKAGADAAADTWFKCIEEEKSMRMSIEAAELALSQATESQEELCQRQVEKSPFSIDAAVIFPVIHCEFDNCDDDVSAFETTVDAAVGHTKTLFDQAEAAWTLAKQECDAANADVEGKTNALHEANAALGPQIESCMHEHESRQILMCSFGSNLQQKCESVTAYENLLAEVDKVNGSDHSVPDMVEEWKTIHVTKCMVSKIIDGGEIDDAALAACDASVDFVRDVGEMNKQEEQFADLTSSEKFTCHEETITFGIDNAGTTWNVPQGDALSEQYTTVPFQPEISLEANTPPFGFCGAPVELATFDPQCAWVDERNAWKCPFRVAAWISALLPLAADWDAHHVSISIDQVRVLQVDGKAAGMAQESTLTLQPQLRAPLDQVEGIVNAGVQLTQGTAVAQLAFAMGAEEDTTLKVVEATFPDKLVDISTQEQIPIVVGNSSNTGASDLCAKSVQVVAGSETFFLTNWENIVFARSHDLNYHCESIWSVECHSGNLVETKYCRYGRFDAPTVEKYCLGGDSCYYSSLTLPYPSKGTLSVRLPGHTDWMLAEPGASWTISIASSPSGPVIDGSEQFEGGLAPEVEDHTVTYQLPGFTDALTNELCTSAFCKWAMNHTLRLVDSHTTIATGDPHMGAWPTKIETHAGAAVIEVVVNMEDVGTAFSYNVKKQLGGAIPEYKVVDVETGVVAHGSEVFLRTLATFSSYVWVE